MAKAAFNKKRAVFARALDLKRKKLVKCCMWSIAFIWC